MSGFPNVIRACIHDTLTRAPALMQHAADRAAEAIEQEQRKLSSTQLRQDYSAALRELHLQRLAWAVDYPRALRKVLENPRPQGSGPRLNPSSLTLVDDTEIAQSIETSRLAMEVQTKVEQSLAELDALMSSALGLDGVQPEHNPLRPEVFSQALRNVLADHGAQPGWPAIWMRHMGAPMAEDLNDLYLHCSKSLKQARVEAAAYRVITAPAPLGMGRPSQPAPLDGVPQQRRQEQSVFARAASGFADLVSHALRGPGLSEFLSRGVPQQAQRALEGSFFSRVDDELRALEATQDEAPLSAEAVQQHAHLPAVDRPTREVGSASALSDGWGAFGAPRQRSLVRARLKKEASNVGQVMGLEVVRQLVDQVARDPRLLAPVREAVVALEPSLARAALNEPRFFGEPEHPARMLVDRVAERSFRYNDEFTSDFQSFFGDVRSRFNALNDDLEFTDAKPFADALEALESGWATQDEQAEEQRKRLVEAAQFAEKRQAEAGEIAWGIGQRSDLDGVPAAIQDFLYSRWAVVMAHARLKGGGREIDPGGFGGVMSDLLWSVKSAETLRDPARAFVLIPRVLLKLRAGLDLIGEQPAANDAFFAALEKLHRPVLKLRAKLRKQTYEPPPNIVPDIDLQPRPAQQPGESEEVWLGSRELHAFGFETQAPAAQVKPAPAAATLPLGETENVLASLHPGRWVDLNSHGKWYRAQLTWASGNGALFMFVSQGGRPHSMTKRTLQKLVMERLVRPIADGEVVQHAIDALAQPVAQPLAA